jgi:polysaccharide deacetylase family sporulation protein PdaB
VSKEIKKIIAVLILLFIGAASSIIFNYKNTGTFMSIKRKLPIYSVDTSDKKVSITFDVSWGSDHTREILDILDKYHIKCTFFIVGAWAEENKELVKEIYARGHEIGNHSYKHPDFTMVSRDRIVQEINKNDNVLEKITGEKPILVRCPEGTYNDLVISTIEATNHYCVQWDADSIDWMQQGEEIEYKRIIKKTQNGSILLFHNYGNNTPKTLPRIIEKLRSSGYTFVKAGDLIYKDNYYIDSTGRQFEQK